MKDELVKLYNEELVGLRKEGEFFADAHPKIASRLKLGQGGVEDPLVGRLLESFAFLTARSRYQMQHEVEQLDENLLQLLYPHYFLPLPACSTLRFDPSEQLEQSYVLPKTTMITTPLLNGDSAYFRTAYPVTVRPINISHVQYKRESTLTPKYPDQKALKSCLTFTLKTNNKSQNLADLDLDSVRLFINATSKTSGHLYELLMSHVKVIMLSYGDAHTLNIPVDSIQPVGFKEDENLLHYEKNSFSGYRLLTEYFAYPEKFLYVDIKNLKEAITLDVGHTIQLHFYFDQYINGLDKLVDNDTLLLHCTPIINLFEKMGESITFDHKQQQYHLVPDAEYKLDNIEVYSLLSLKVSSTKYKDKIDSAPYFGRTFSQKNNSYLYWDISRRACDVLGQPHTQGDEVFISISDFNLEGIDEQLILTPQLLCTNRDAPQHLPFGGGKPEWKFHDGAHELIENMKCVKTITSAKYRHTREYNRVDLAKHIYLNQVAYADPEQTLQSLKTVLSLYRFGQEHHDKIIESGLVSAIAKPVTIRHPDPLQQGFCRGIQYDLTIDESHFPDGDSYLLGCILEEFLSKSCSMNAFISLTLTSVQRGELFKWRPRLGIKPIL